MNMHKEALKLHLENILKLPKKGQLGALIVFISTNILPYRELTVGQFFLFCLENNKIDQNTSLSDAIYEIANVFGLGEGGD